MYDWLAINEIHMKSVPVMTWRFKSKNMSSIENMGSNNSTKVDVKMKESNLTEQELTKETL